MAISAVAPPDRFTAACADGCQKSAVSPRRVWIDSALGWRVAQIVIIDLNDLLQQDGGSQLARESLKAPCHGWGDCNATSKSDKIGVVCIRELTFEVLGQGPELSCFRFRNLDLENLSERRVRRPLRFYGCAWA